MREEQGIRNDELGMMNKYLAENKKEYVISKQLLRSGTGIGTLIGSQKCRKQ
jgi:hypothetical protein